MTDEAPEALKAPFDIYGNLLRDPRRQPEDQEVVWRPAEPFTATLTLGEYLQGKCTPHVTWINEDYKFYPMFLSDLVETLRTVPIAKGGIVTAEWIVHQRGLNYGIRLNLDRKARRMARFGHE